MPEIICKWCKAKYQAYNNNRSHCSRPDCRNREIESNLKMLRNCIDMLLRHSIVAEVELRCPGNDTFGQQVRVKSEGYLYNDFNGKDTTVETADIIKELKMITNYFRPILQKGLKGNFICGTNADGRIDIKILNEIFTSLKEPAILGNNCFLNRTAK